MAEMQEREKARELEGEGCALGAQQQDSVWSQAGVDLAAGKELLR